MLSGVRLTEWSAPSHREPRARDDAGAGGTDPCGKPLGV
jgi:hypothetical protein